jgi:ATP-dependent Lon protease
MSESKEINNSTTPSVPLRDLVVFPYMVATVIVGRKKSIAAVEEAKKKNNLIFFVAQKAENLEKFSPRNVHKYGTMCQIVEYKKQEDDSIKLIIKGVKKAKLINIIDQENYLCSEVEEIEEEKNENIKLLDETLFDIFKKYSKYDKNLNESVFEFIKNSKNQLETLYKICQFIDCKHNKKQEILEESKLVKKFKIAIKLINNELGAINVEMEVASAVQKKISKSQKELYLNEQLKYIKKELGKDDNKDDDEITTLKKNLAKLKLPKEVKDKTDSEVKKLEKLNPFSSEAGIIRSYLELIVDLPWSKSSNINLNLSKAEKTLGKNHYALSKAKDAILEFIAVQIKSKSIQGKIICLAGPPGVGKTSMASSIAQSLALHYIKISLGGMRDESEIRGHRKTYIGAMPGKLINAMKKAKVNNPLILLDEIDKMSSDFRGDPASAMLEVLDPEQNKNFSDHYLEVEYDLSKVMFVATANDISLIPTPLRDRMEIINISGYTENEKLHIAKDHLIPKIRKNNALNAEEFKITDEAILQIIHKYTFEAGIRNLEREISKLSRKLARKIISEELKSLNFTKKNISEYLGPEKTDYGKIKDESQVGIARGLSYTIFGGDLLDIEVIKFAGEGKINITGKLGDVMKESVQTAFSYVKSIAKDLKIDKEILKKYDLHVHFPEGATPKDGPSAGIAICLALSSCLSNRPIKKDLAITGEITLTGRSLAIGGLKEKLLAALRGDIKNVIIPEENKKNILELPQEIKDGLNIKPIKYAKEAIEFGLETI